jgi:hypothetical protein
MLLGYHRFQLVAPYIDCIADPYNAITLNKETIKAAATFITTYNNTCSACNSFSSIPNEEVHFFTQSSIFCWLVVMLVEICNH